MSTLSQQLTQLNQQFDAAFNAKQADAIGPLYAEHAVVMPAPAGAPIQGREAIMSFFKGLIDMGIHHHQLAMTGLVESETQATQYGTWAGALTGEDGVTQQFGGNVQLVFARQADHRWLVVTHIWN